VLTAIYNDTLKQLQHNNTDPAAKGKHCLQNGTDININAEPLLVCRSIFGNGKLRLLQRIIKQVNIIYLVLQIQLGQNRRSLFFRH
jgi:hypothetical protein